MCWDEQGMGLEVSICKKVPQKSLSHYMYTVKMHLFFLWQAAVCPLLITVNVSKLLIYPV